MQELVRRIAAESRLQNSLRVPVGLEIVGSGAFQPPADLYKIFFCVKLLHNGSAEFIIKSAA